MLEIKANKSIHLDGERVDVGDGSMGDFLMSSLGCSVTLDKDLVVGDLIHVLYDISKFINSYCCEEYEVGRALINAGRLAEGRDYLRIFKNAEITTEGFFKMNTQFELCSHEGMGRIQNVCNLKMVLDPNIIDGDEILREDACWKADFTLLEIIEVLFENFLYSLKKDNILI